MRREHKILSSMTWLPAYVRHALTDHRVAAQRHLIIALADHFEPCYTGTPNVYHPVGEQVRRVRDWCARYPAAVDEWRDADGQAFKHTYFYPAEHYHPEVLEVLAEFCRQGWGEIEIHLHHGVDRPDTSENTRYMLETFREQLVEHGCLSRFDRDSSPSYAFVHGNWALANSANNRFCGVDDEMQILAETGCYADFTLPSAPDPSQIAKINSIYECTLPMNRRAPHRRGRNLRVGAAPANPPIIVQGPLMVDLVRRPGRLLPRLENGDITSTNPGTLHRLKLWRDAGIIVEGRPEWCFIKLHCHGMIDRDESAMLGALKTQFVRDLVHAQNQGLQVHFVSAREMVNIIYAACDGATGSPGEFRDYRLKLLTSAKPLGTLQSTTRPAE